MGSNKNDSESAASEQRTMSEDLELERMRNRLNEFKALFDKIKDTSSPEYKAATKGLDTLVEEYNKLATAYPDRNKKIYTAATSESSSPDVAPANPANQSEDTDTAPPSPDSLSPETEDADIPPPSLDSPPPEADEVAEKEEKAAAANKNTPSPSPSPKKKEGTEADLGNGLYNSLLKATQQEDVIAGLAKKSGLTYIADKATQPIRNAVKDNVINPLKEKAREGYDYAMSKISPTPKQALEQVEKIENQGASNTAEPTPENQSGVKPIKPKF